VHILGPVAWLNRCRRAALLCVSVCVSVCVYVYVCVVRFELSESGQPCELIHFKGHHGIICFTHRACACVLCVLCRTSSRNVSNLASKFTIKDIMASSVHTSHFCVLCVLCRTSLQNVSNLVSELI
jgi:hypothetical protein